MCDCVCMHDCLDRIPSFLPSVAFPDCAQRSLSILPKEPLPSKRNVIKRSPDIR